jgi:hypothetical protein
VRPDFKRPPFEEFDALRFSARANMATAEDPLVFEVRVFSGSRPASFWRRVTLNSDRWEFIELPLRFFRQSAGASLDWSEVTRFGFHFRNVGEISIDGIELIRTGASGSPYLSPEELGTLAFGQNAKMFSNEQFVVLTNDERVNGRSVLDEFEKLSRFIFADFPGFTRPVRKIPMLIFATERQYRDFWPRFGAKFASVIPPINSDGYSVLGVAGSYYSPEFGPVRPVFIHEACHAILAPVMGLSNSGEWLHEGLANYYQLRWTKQNIHELTKKMISDGSHVPFSQLLNGDSVRMRHYAQITLVMQWMMGDPELRQSLQNAIKTMKMRSSTSLEPVCERHFQRTLEELELDWLRWAREQGNAIKPAKSLD